MSGLPQLAANDLACFIGLNCRFMSRLPDFAGRRISGATPFFWRLMRAARTQNGKTREKSSENVS